MKKPNVIRGLVLASLVIVQFLFFYTVLTKAAYVSLTVSSEVVPSTIESGGSGNLVLTIANGGTEYARNVKLTVKPHSSITFGTSQYSLQTIAPSSSTQVSVPMTISSSASEGSTSIFLSIEYTEGSGSGAITTETSVSLSISKRTLIEVSNVTYDEDIIEQGDVVKMDLEIKNVGSGEIKDLFVELNRSQPFVSASGDMEVYVGNVGHGQTKIASFDIIIDSDAETKAYSVPVTLTYYDDAGSLYTEEKYVGMRISGVPNFVVALEDQENMYSGSTGELTISLSNRGTASAAYLLASFDSQYDITPKEYYIGDLEQDDYETITLIMSLAGIKSGKHTLDIGLSYKDPYNQEYTTTESIEFTIASAPPFMLSPIYIIGILFVIGLLVWKRKTVMGFLAKVIKR